MRTICILTLLSLGCAFTPRATATAGESQLDGVTPPAESDDALFHLLGNPLDTSGELWERLSLPTDDAHLTVRVSDPGSEPYPAHLMRLTGTVDRTKTGMLLQRDAAEPDAADLWRAGLETRFRASRIVAGDFRVDQSLGWTVASSPSWSASTDALAPLRSFDRGVRINLSSEEGWGWRGLAVSTSLAPDDAVGPNGLDLWAGYASYDALPRSDGSLFPLATQGDHTDPRIEVLEKLSLVHSGGKLGIALPFHAGTAQLIGTSTRLQDKISTDAAARFRFASQSLNAFGSGWSWTDNTGWRTIQLEAATQGGNRWGGGISTASRVAGEIALIFSASRATHCFATLYSRPWLPFGSDPAGKTDLLLAWLARWTRFTATTGAAVEFEENSPESNADSRREAWFLTLANRPPDKFRVDAALSLQRTITSGSASPVLIAGRLLLRRDLSGLRYDLRLDSAGDQTGSALAATAGLRQHLARSFALSLALSGVTRDGEGATVNLVQPAGPEIFPVRRVNRNMLSAGLRLDISPVSGMVLWCSAGIDHSLDETVSSSPAETTRLSLGLEWSDFPGP